MTFAVAQYGFDLSNQKLELACRITTETAAITFITLIYTILLLRARLFFPKINPPYHSCHFILPFVDRFFKRLFYMLRLPFARCAYYAKQVEV